jgi:general secretion pathway protein K
MFLMGVTMARGISMGAPIFSSPQDYINTMKGSGALGPMLTMLGMKPVKFLSESDFAKSITIESKMFSIYAVGIVKGYKRETRSSLVEVLDFRKAPVIQGPSLQSVMGGASSASASATAAPTASAANASGPIASATANNPAGQVIYFHVD